MKVKIDDQEATVNTSKPITSDDCLLFQAWAFPRTKMHELRVENANGASLGINRVEFFTVTPYGKGGGTRKNGLIIAGIVIVVVFTVMAVIVITWKVHKKKKNVIGHTKVSDF